MFVRESEALYDSRGFEGYGDSPSNLAALDCDAQNIRATCAASERQGREALESRPGRESPKTERDTQAWAKEGILKTKAARC